MGDSRGATVKVGGVVTCGDAVRTAGKTGEVVASALLASVALVGFARMAAAAVLTAELNGRGTRAALSGLESGVAKDCGAALVDLDCSCPLGSCLSDIVDFPDKTY